MEIRYVTSMDNPLDISKIYEQSWKYAYKNIIKYSYKSMRTKLDCS
ncbi:MAG: hypothetical protein Q606_CBAC00006G0002 [Intestinibacter bartlettii DORA_8_9]|uniref:Uncharacterized protein n=1 Tax=Intestinibacter bartlettii TaxID=261299 RepID=A0A6N3CEM5_9FIRM|nr:MAG: hypothetical protein Q606_CBAC00006G0002 [Intestinibacter bartlettii DORA_8_9]